MLLNLRQIKMADEKFEVMSEPKKIFDKMLEDIKNAKRYIYLENYIYENDEIGREFKDILIERAKKGIIVKILIDAWGSRLPIGYWDELEKHNGQMKYFRELQYTWRIISKNHERNHRKLLIIDDEISYIGSLNITKRFIEWRELVMRFEGDVAKSFKKVFNHTWNNYGILNSKDLSSVLHEDLEIIQDIPSAIKRFTEKRYIKLIKNSKKEVDIETPYLVPSFRMRRAFVRAVERGVKVKLIIPYKSNWPIVDVIRNRYLGFLHRGGVEIYYYKQKMLHSKLLIIDGEFFLLGSSNLDYRSFLHNFELNILGSDKKMVGELKNYFNETLRGSVKFNYEEWEKRSSFKKILELIASKVRKFA